MKTLTQEQLFAPGDIDFLIKEGDATQEEMKALVILKKFFETNDLPLTYRNYTNSQLLILMKETMIVSGVPVNQMSKRVPHYDDLLKMKAAKIARSNFKDEEVVAATTLILQQLFSFQLNVDLGDSTQKEKIVSIVEEMLPKDTSVPTISYTKGILHPHFFEFIFGSAWDTQSLGREFRRIWDEMANSIQGIELSRTPSSLVVGTGSENLYEPGPNGTKDLALAVVSVEDVSLTVTPPTRPGLTVVSAFIQREEGVRTNPSGDRSRLSLLSKDNGGTTISVQTNETVPVLLFGTHSINTNSVLNIGIVALAAFQSRCLDYLRRIDYDENLFTPNENVFVQQLNSNLAILAQVLLDGFHGNLNNGNEPIVVEAFNDFLDQVILSFSSGQYDDLMAFHTDVIRNFKSYFPTGFFTEPVSEEGDGR